MKFLYFEIKNFKGIKHLKLDLSKSPFGNIYPLVGLNESGKTTILEGINHFFPSSDKALKTLHKEKLTSDNPHELIPISERANFNDGISIEAGIKFHYEDKKELLNYAKNELKCSLDLDSLGDVFSIEARLKFENSTYKSRTSYWNVGLFETVGGKSKEPLKGEDDRWKKIVSFIENQIPQILFFPTFSFELPEKIYLEESDKDTLPDIYFRRIVQDILDSLNNELTIQKHILDRAKSPQKKDKASLEAVLNKLETHVTKNVFQAWNQLFHKSLSIKEINIKYGTEGRGKNKRGFYLQFSVKEGESNYSISERALGFRWFFCFLLFIHFRGYRKGNRKALFLFDEPASNLHATAQEKLLQCFESTAKKDYQIIYSTHSQHLINPKWLENTFIIKNKGLAYENPGLYDYSVQETNISVDSYRNFVSKYPGETTYFQPILDVLDYQPCKLENIPNAIIMEGKYDYYFLVYFQNQIGGKYKLNFLPGQGAGKLDTLISLYIGWGRKFIIILDADKAGIKQKERYIEEYLLSTTQVFTLEDIHANWKNFKFEDLFSQPAKNHLSQKNKSSGTSKKISKKDLARTIQEMLINNESWNFCQDTLNNFKVLIDFAAAKLENIRSNPYKKNLIST